MSEKPYLLVSEVAAKLRVSKITVYRMINSGEIPAKKFGKQWRFDPEEIMEWVKPVSGEKRPSRV